MKLPISFAAVGVALVATHALAQPAGLTPVGTWLTEDGRAKIRLERCGEGENRLCGFVAWMKDPLNDKGQPKTDIRNPDPAKRSRAALGMELMEGLQPEDDAHYSGEIYNAENGKKYAVTLAVEKAEELEVKGCLLKFLCGSQTWTRVADVALPANKVVSNTVKTGKAPVPGGARLHDTQPAR